MIALRQYGPADAPDWDRFVNHEARNGHFLFCRGYMDYHRRRFQDHSLIFSRGNRIVALLPANLCKNTLHSHQGLTFGGMLVSPRVRLETSRELFSLLIDHLKASGIAELVYRAMPHPYQRIFGEEDRFVLGELGATVAELKVGCALRLGSSLGFTASRRRELGKACHCSIRSGSETDLADFMSLCACCLRDRHGAEPVHSTAEMKMLARRFPDRIRFIGAWQGGALVAGLLIYRSTPCSRVQYAASSAEGRRCAALDATYEYLLTKELEPGTWLDLGTSMDPVSGELNLSLQFYKESLGARTLLFHTYRLALK